MILNFAYACNLRALILLPGDTGFQIDSDKDVIEHVNRGYIALLEYQYEDWVKDEAK